MELAVRYQDSRSLWYSIQYVTTVRREVHMHSEPADNDDENQLLVAIDEALSVVYVGNATLEESSEIWKRIQSNCGRVMYLVPHIINRYRTDQERCYAEAELLRLLGETRELSESFADAFNMLGFLHYRGVEINT